MLKEYVSGEAKTCVKTKPIMETPEMGDVAIKFPRDFHSVQGEDDNLEFKEEKDVQPVQNDRGILEEIQRDHKDNQSHTILNQRSLKCGDPLKDCHDIENLFKGGNSVVTCVIPLRLIYLEECGVSTIKEHTKNLKNGVPQKTTTTFAAKHNERKGETLE